MTQAEMAAGATKKAVKDLAVIGGTPLFSDPLHVGKPNLPTFADFAARMQRVFERGWLTNRGPEVLEFERRIGEIAGVKHCISVSNATVGLEVAARALRMSGEVIVPAFTFVATAHAITWQGVQPVFCDIDPATHCLDPRKVEALISDRTTGIIGVHLWGNVCDVEELERIARRHRLALLFDAAHAFGCSRQGRPVGVFGNAEVFSFHATKFLNASEGGAVVTNDDALAERIRLMTNFGFVGNDHVVAVGTNAKMSEASAAMGIASLDHMSEVLACNRRNYAQYTEELGGIPGVIQNPVLDPSESNLQYVIVEVDPEESGIHRDALLAILQAENVLARRYFYPGVHRMQPYRQTWGTTRTLPHTDRLTERVLVLPTGRAIGRSEISGVCGLIRFAVENAAEILARFPADALARVPDLR